MERYNYLEEVTNDAKEAILENLNDWNFSDRDELEEACNALVKKTFDMLYILCEGQKKTHSDLIKQAQLLLPITAGTQDVNQLPEYNDILKSIIDLYEIEVGIKKTGCF